MTTVAGKDFLPFHLADIGDAEIEAVVETLKSGWLTMGPRVAEFEAAFADHLGVEHAIAVNSATAALHLGLEALGVRAGDEVIVPSMTFAASAEVVIYLGATPVLVDCDPETLTVRAEDIGPHLSPRTRVIMPVHYGGLSCDMDPILELARAHGIATIDDAAHAFPAVYRGRPIGVLADATAFSFYATKTLSTGEGGMLTTGDAAVAERVRLMRLHGITRHAWNRYAAEGMWRYEILEAGFKYNMTDLTAALGLVQLRRQREMTDGRLRVVRAYDEAFSGLDGIGLPARRDYADNAWHLYPIRVNSGRLRISRDAFIEALRTRGIGCSVHFIPLHLHPLYRDKFGYVPGDLPNAAAAFEELISLPVYSKMTVADIARVIEAVAGIARANLA